MVKTIRYKNTKKYAKSRKYMKSRQTRKNRRKRGGGNKGFGEDCRPGGGGGGVIASFSSCDEGLECVPKISPGNMFGSTHKCVYPKSYMGLSKLINPGMSSDI
jgi:hypothetical protein